MSINYNIFSLPNKTRMAFIEFSLAAKHLDIIKMKGPLILTPNNSIKNLFNMFQY